MLTNFKSDYVYCYLFQELNVSGCTGGDLTGDSLLLHASRCQYLTSLDASWCQVTDNGLAAISDSCKRYGVTSWGQFHRAA